MSQVKSSLFPARVKTGAILISLTPKRELKRSQNVVIYLLGKYELIFFGGGVVISDSLRNGGNRIQEDRCVHLVNIDSPFLHRLSEVAQKAVSFPPPPREF